ncbi:TPA: hypothetical protein ACYLN4_007566 [Burkholderia lata]
MNQQDNRKTPAKSAAGEKDSRESTGSARFPVGTIVGARRWPYVGNHPGCWGTPWKGEVLALNDQRAWAKNVTLSTQQKIDAHVAWCDKQGLFEDSVPVLWDFGDEKIVYFQTASNLWPYAVDYLDWQAARAAAFRREAERMAVCEPCL